MQKENNKAQTRPIQKTKIMGVINITPDSFSDGGKYFNTERAIRQGLQLAEDGADILDIGGESSRPGAEPVSAEEEIRRVLPAIKELARLVSIPISIDTRKPEVARACAQAGATIINDITGFTQKEMIDIAAQYNTTIVIMHMQGNPQTMQNAPKYSNVVEEVYTFLKKQTEACKKQGITKMFIDPGIGFGKTLEQNLDLIKNISYFTEIAPVLIGTSRKSFLGKITGRDVNNRFEETLASVVLSIRNGASIVRVHDVKKLLPAVQVADALR